MKKIKEILFISLFFLLVASIGFDLWNMWQNVPRGTFKEKPYFDSVFNELHRAQVMDSLMDARDARKIDSIMTIYSSISERMRVNNIKLNQIKRSNEALRTELNNLMPVDRPDF